MEGSTGGTSLGTAGVCGTYGDIRKLKPKGASAKTAKSDKLSIKGLLNHLCDLY